MGQSRRLNFLGLSTALCLGLSTVLIRSYHLPQNFIFAEDQEDLALRVKQIVVDRQPTLISAKFSQIGLYLPPGYLYFLIPFFLITDWHPIATMIVVVAFAGVTGALLYLAGFKLGGAKVGLVAWILYSFNPLLHTWDRIFWNPNLILPAAALVAFSLVTKNLWLGALGSGVALQSHPQAIGLVLITLIYFRRRWPTLAATIFLAISPWFLFELRHGWPITQAALAQSGFTFRPYYLLFVYPFLFLSLAWIITRHKLLLLASITLLMFQNLPIIFNQSVRFDNLNFKLAQASLALEEIKSQPQPRVHFLTSSEGYNYIFWYLTRDTHIPPITYYQSWQNAPAPKAVISH